ncbi:hypothetical protein Syun_031313 [Stephania yunnanensis]|uniref:Uncharacterized protein n=1 Tax=Stephania yunnanensis TaxID=152371 RepID=A0AAP0DWD5_9MAGN
MVPRSEFDRVAEQLRQVVAFMQRQFGMITDGAGLSQPQPQPPTPPPPSHEEQQPLIQPSISTAPGSYFFLANCKGIDVDEHVVGSVELVIIPRSIINDNPQEQQNQPPPPPPPPPQNEDSTEEQNEEEDEENAKGAALQLLAESYTSRDQVVVLKCFKSRKRVVLKGYHVSPIFENFESLVKLIDQVSIEKGLGLNQTEPSSAQPSRTRLGSRA